MRQQSVRCVTAGWVAFSALTLSFAAEEGLFNEDSLEVLFRGQAAGFRSFVTTSNTVAQSRTDVKITWDAQGLTAVFACADDQVMARPRARDDRESWRDDSVDIFLDPGHTHDYRDKWFHVLVTAAGAVFDERGGATDWGKFTDNGFLRAGHVDFDAQGVRAAVSAETGGWRAVVAIPWADIGRRPATGEVWGIQFGRANYPEGEYSAWVPTYGPFNRLHQWGHVLFVEPDTEQWKGFLTRAARQIAARHAELQGGPLEYGELLFPSAVNPDPARLPTLSVWMYRSRPMVAMEFPGKPGWRSDAWCYEDSQFISARALEGGQLELRHRYDSAWTLVTLVVPEPGAVEYRARLESESWVNQQLPREPLAAPNLCWQLWRTVGIGHGQVSNSFTAPVIGAVARDGTFLTAIAGSGVKEMSQAWHDCLHANPPWFPERGPIADRRWRVKIYMLPNDPPKLLERVRSDFPADR